MPDVPAAGSLREDPNPLEAGSRSQPLADLTDYSGPGWVATLSSEGDDIAEAQAWQEPRGSVIVEIESGFVPISVQEARLSEAHMQVIDR